MRPQIKSVNHHAKSTHTHARIHPSCSLPIENGGAIAAPPRSAPRRHCQLAAATARAAVARSGPRRQDRAGHHVVVAGPDQPAEPVGARRLPARREAHGVAPLLAHLAEAQRRRLHRHLDRRAARRGRRRHLVRAGLPDVGQRAGVLLRAARRGERGRERRVVERRHGVRAVGAAVVRRVLGERRDLRRLVLDGAEEVQVVGGGEVVHQPRVHRLAGVDVPGPHVQRRGRALGGHVEQAVAVGVRGVCGGHQRRPDGRRAPVLVRRAEQRRQPAHVRARHGRAGDYVEAGAPVVAGDPRWADGSGPRREDVHPRGDQVRLQDAGRHGVRPPRREGGHDGRRLDPNLRAGEHYVGRRLRIRRRVGSHGVAGLLSDAGARENVRVGDQLLAVGGGVGEHHAGTTGVSDDESLLDPGVGAAVAEDDLAGDLGRDEGACHAERAHAAVRRVPCVDERHRRGGQLLAVVEGDAVVLVTVPEGDVGGEVAVECPRAHGGDPWRAVRQRRRAGPGISRRAGHKYSPFHGAVRAHGDAVAVVVRRATAEGQGEHVHAVGDGDLHALEDVGAEAAADPAHLVRGHARARRHALGRARRVAQQVGAAHGGARRRAGGVRAVAVVVPGRARLLRRVHGALGRLVARQEVPGADELPVARGGVEIAPALALALPARRHGAEARVVVAGPLRPHAGVEHADDDVARGVGLGEERLRPVQPEELRCPGGVQLVPRLRVDEQHAGLRLQRPGLRAGEPRRVAVEQGVVGVDHLGGAAGHGLQRRGVPVAVRRELAGHGGVRAVDDVRPPAIVHDLRRRRRRHDGRDHGHGEERRSPAMAPHREKLCNWGCHLVNGSAG
ncbi:hypothetical protein CFC21_079621 [Triticum aestivum]|uniref:Uncharacterized protein n=2 Tax=Triticum aestivum TaxID=4565 RepID=A0A9R1I0I5_WHEAT|nr:hypothetical protein CFC21_079618 [Triticum aestivum]KAF7074801.1 hypothetical protein CFC21_079621 [Triticum aestivum]